MASQVYTFDLPPISLKTNRRMGGHWSATHSLKVAYRDICALRVKSQHRGETIKACHVTATVYLGKGQRCDPSDLGSWAKVPIDTLVAGGAIASDSASCIKRFTAIVERDPGNPRLEIELKEGA